MELFFESRPEILTVRGAMNVVQGACAVTPEPVFSPDRARGEGGVEALGTILRDAGRFRMWYMFLAADYTDGMDGCYVGYAESDNGLDWKRPTLNAVEYLGSKANNICNMGMSSPSVFIDPDAPPSHRYRATGFAQTNYKGTCIGNSPHKFGYYSQHSADGIHWELDDREPKWPVSNDNIISYWHPRQRRAIVLFKREKFVGGASRRVFWEAEFRNGKWSEERCVLVPDEFDDLAARARGYVSGDYYHLGFLAAGSGTAGFISHFRHRLPLHMNNKIGFFGSVDLGLVYQRGRGDSWQHVYGRPDFVRHGQYPWMRECVYPSSAVVEVGDEQWLYITGHPFVHGFAYNENLRPVPEKANAGTAAGVSYIGIAKWPKNRLFGFGTDTVGYLKMDLGLITTPSQLVLNARTGLCGQVFVEVISEDGTATLAKSRPLTGDHLDGVVQWERGPQMPTPRGPTHIWLHAHNAEIYGFEVCPLAKGA